MGRLLSVIVALSLVAGISLSQPEPIRAKEGERTLSPAQQARALAGMTPEERKHLGELWSNRRDILPVAYTRTLIKDGRVVGGYEETAATSALVIPNTLTADGTGTGGAYDLYMSVAVYRLGGSGYRWGIETYFQWNNTGSMDPDNRDEDSLGTYWGDNSLYAVGDTWSGRTNTGTSLYMYRSDISQTGNGLGHSFREMIHGNFVSCGAGTSCIYARWGRTNITVSQNSWKGRTDQVGAKYVHSKGTGISYSLSIGGFGISVSPTANQWSAVAYTNISH